MISVQVYHEQSVKARDCWQKSNRKGYIMDYKLLSNIRGPEDVKKLKENGTDAVLIGEMLMRSDSKSHLIERLKNI